MHFRLARPEDAAALLEIYREYMDTPVTFEYVLPSIEAFAGRIRSISAFYPYIVAEDDDGTPIGYAYAHRHMERAAYQWNAELSVYLSPRAAGKGLGTKLYEKLMALLRAQGVLAVFGCVTVPNPPSDHLHEKLGFRLVGTYELAGFKNGKWHSVSWYQKMLGAHSDAPEAPAALSELDPDAVRQILES